MHLYLVTQGFTAKMQSLIHIPLLIKSNQFQFHVLVPRYAKTNSSPPDSMVRSCICTSHKLSNESGEAHNALKLLRTLSTNMEATGDQSERRWTLTPTISGLKWGLSGLTRRNLQFIESFMGLGSIPRQKEPSSEPGELARSLR
jgi:hypothetical protein